MAVAAAEAVGVRVPARVRALVAPVPVRVEGVSS
jgi:hypothetical protein